MELVGNGAAIAPFFFAGLRHGMASYHLQVIPDYLMSAPIQTIDFSATLFFKDKPDFQLNALIESWGKEGYTCEILEPGDDLFRVIRGETGVYIGHVEPIQHDAHPNYYPDIAQIDIPYDETYLINHHEAFADFQSCHYEVPFSFRMVEQDNPLIVHNEFVITLLGIRQVLPVDAIWLDHLSIFVGRLDIEEYTDYACTQDGMPPASIPYPLLFGVLFQQDKGIFRTWSTGLNHFQHPNLLVESNSISALDAARVVFNACMSVAGDKQFQAGESMETAGIRCQIADCVWDEKPMLKFIPAI
ncbi:hypothetical protein [Chitinivorax sp. B]|uniref:hypothetical protein n=1 Tax=Chitinivorax sp. B TaxID=2502235 RepID=UPI0010F4E496|nr:hypothetical protein [Chitinivorax sp. B]